MFKAVCAYSLRCLRTKLGLVFYSTNSRYKNVIKCGTSSFAILSSVCLILKDKYRLIDTVLILIVGRDQFLSAKE